MEVEAEVEEMVVDNEGRERGERERRIVYVYVCIYIERVCI